MYYIDDLPPEAAQAQTLEELLALLGDPYTVYMSKEEQKKFKEIEEKYKEEIEEYKNKITIEGLYTLKSIHKLIRKKNIKIPTIDITYDIVFKDKKIDKLIEYLMI